MKSKEKKGIIILIITSVLIIIMISFIKNGKNKNQVTEQYTKTESDGTVVNISNKVNEEKEVNGFTVSDIKFTEKDGKTLLTANVTNTTGKAQNGFLVDIVLYDKTEKEFARIPGTIVSTQNGETIKIKAEITENYVDCYDIKIVKK